MHIVSQEASEDSWAARTAGQVKMGINHFIGVLASQNFRKSVIISDGEGAVVSLVDELATWSRGEHQ